MNITVGRHHLPQDLLVEVLLRLPVKSLVRFKCVCKHWYALITSPTFIEKHFRHEHNHARLLICNLTLTQESKWMAFSFLPHKIVPGVSPEQETVHQPWKATNFYAIEGQVHGLFLVHLAMIFDEYDILTLWNPATREFWRLPTVSFELPPYEEYDDKLALGFDPLTQDYKVLWIRMYWEDGGKSCFVNVYSLRNNSWKNLRADFPYLCNLQDAIGSTYLNGVYYQHFWRQDESFGICSFDMGSEQFGELQGPDIPKGQWEKLMLRGDSLAMLVTADGPFNPMTAIYDVWVMNQEGSWTKALRFQPQIVAYLPLNVSEDDKMILEIIEKETSQLVLYDPTIGQVIDLGFQIDLNLGCFWVFNYRESLVQIKRINDSEGKDNVV